MFFIGAPCIYPCLYHAAHDACGNNDSVSWRQWTERQRDGQSHTCSRSSNHQSGGLSPVRRLSGETCYPPWTPTARPTVRPLLSLLLLLLLVVVRKWCDICRVPRRARLARTSRRRVDGNRITPTSELVCIANAINTDDRTGRGGAASQHAWRRRPAIACQSGRRCRASA